MDILSVNNICFKTDNKYILEDISFSIKKGSITALCGNNGAGKTTLIKVLKGLLKVSLGEIYINGLNVTKKSGERLKKIGLVFQDPDLQIVGETVEKDIEFGLRNLNLTSVEIERKVNKVINELKLIDLRNRDPLTLSGGEKRKLILADILVMDPDIIILDEIFANLDYPNVKVVLKLIQELKDLNQTVIIVSHNVEKFLFLTDNLILLKNGKVVYNGKSSLSIEVLKENEICSQNSFFENMLMP